MNVSKRLIASLGLVMVCASPLLQAAPGPDDHRDDHQQFGDNRGPGPGPQQGHDDHGRDDHGRNGPPQDFGPVRQTFHDNRQFIGRGQPLPPNVHIERGRPMPRGYGRPLDSRALAHLPRYDGYEWRRTGNDVVLVAVGTGLVYEILDNVLQE